MFFMFCVIIEVCEGLIVWSVLCMLSLIWMCFLCVSGDVRCICYVVGEVVVMVYLWLLRYVLCMSDISGLFLLMVFVYMWSMIFWSGVCLLCV